MSHLVGNPSPIVSADIAMSGEDRSDARKRITIPSGSDMWTVFFWYPHDFSMICPTELLSLSDSYDDFVELEAQIVAASTDSIFTHRAWLAVPRSEDGLAGLRYPLLADPSGEIARKWGVYQEELGCASRTCFILDPTGVVQYSCTHSMSTGRSVQEILRVIAALQTGELCGSDWTPGQSALQP